MGDGYSSADTIRLLIAEAVGGAGAGGGAVDSARPLAPDVTVRAVGMPLLEGLEATDRIRRRTPATQVVIFTASESERDVRRAREVGAAAYVLKTHLHAVLLATIRRASGREERAASVLKTAPTIEALPATP